MTVTLVKLIYFMIAMKGNTILLLYYTTKSQIKI